MVRLLASKLSLVLVASALCTSAFAQMSIFVEDTALDTVGSRLAFAVKERIRTTSGFKLVTARADAAFRLSLVTLDDKTGYSTVYSVVFTAWQPQTNTWTYLNNIVGTCGTSRIAECADGLVADADKAAEEPREFYRTYYRDKGTK